MSASEIVTTPGSVEGIRVERVITRGVFALDGGEWEVDNNIWLVGNDDEVLVIDAAHEAEPVIEAIDGRTVRAIVLTHGHNDHINASGELAKATGAPRWIHPDDRMLWDAEFGDTPPDGDLADGQIIEVGGLPLTVLHTPGHSPGGVCLHSPDLAVLFSGDTLFHGGPGATGRSFSDFDTIVASITDRLLTLPGETLVLTGHGDSTTIGEEAPDRQKWIDEHDD
ncbi:MBL fold metallo-hydrolase [Mobilicoccus massiliensis]|uniref:MBL fold metallo-hydrolase n=1 Tax=Mobilicoccus massiliensis TaxID=1522310 RepID=UPI0009E4C6A8|nr:MBL fold metallo-hydrolase [Mobilicoccus massiliensis]